MESWIRLISIVGIIRCLLFEVTKFRLGIYVHVHVADLVGINFSDEIVHEYCGNCILCKY